MTKREHIEGGGIDECLWPYLKSLDQSSIQTSLDQLLIEIAKPLAEQIVERAFRATQNQGILWDDTRDITAEVLLKILKRLKAFKTDPAASPISNFRGMVATTTYRTLTDQLREVDRRRANQERKLRRLFAANQNLSIWRDQQGKVVCGYEIWKDRESDAPPEPSVYPNLLSLTKIVDDAEHALNTAELVLSLLDQTGKPIRFADLVSVVFSSDHGEHEMVERTPANTSDLKSIASVTEPSATYELRMLLAAIFDEIGKLNSVQGQALLLNMTDSYGFSIEWFVFTGIASEAQLANLLDLSVDEFNHLLDRLPMTDKEIAVRLNLDSVNVGNIRKGVRDRLKRRRQAFLRGER